MLPGLGGSWGLRGFGRAAVTPPASPWGASHLLSTQELHSVIYSKCKSGYGLPPG